MNRQNQKRKPNRRGVIAVLAAILLIVMLGMVAFSVDLGYIGVVRTQLQAAADAAALAAAGSSSQGAAGMVAAAQQFASANMAAGRPIQLSASDVQFGTWDAATRTFNTTNQVATAVKVTVRTDDNNGGATGLFFGRLLGVNSVDQRASAVAAFNPRDIAFVVDLSGSMNDDTEPDSTSSINSTYAAQGYPTIGSELLNQVYADFGFGVTYPNEPSQYIGQGLSGVSKKSSFSTTFSQLTSTSGPLSKSSIPTQYRIKSTDSTSTRNTKAYSWLMDVQLGDNLLPAAKPAPNSTNSGSYEYWQDYIDRYWDKLGYRSYTQFMMYYGGRTSKPGGSLYSSLSQYSPDCPFHSEATAGGTFSFPPREMPTHAARRAIIAALKVIKDVNQNITDPNQRDWVSIITFDAKSNGAVVRTPLTSNYDTAMQSCTTLQAVADALGASTATEVGLIEAANHIKPTTEGGFGRQMTNKIVVLLTDGMPNQYSSSNSAIAAYRTANPSSNFYGGSSNYSQDAALMQTSMAQGNNWYLYPVGIGLGCNYDFMDRMARMGATANNSGESARGTGNPAQYEAVLTQIFQNIITNPKLRLVQ